MQIVIDKELLVKMMAVVLSAVTSNDYQTAKDCVNEILEGMGYEVLPKGHGRLIDADSFLAKYETCGYIEDMEVDYFNTVTPTIIEADREGNNADRN